MFEREQKNAHIFPKTAAAQHQFLLAGFLSAIVADGLQLLVFEPMLQTFDQWPWIFAAVAAARCVGIAGRNDIVHKANQRRQRIANFPIF